MILMIVERRKGKIALLISVLLRLDEYSAITNLNLFTPTSPASFGGKVSNDAPTGFSLINFSSELFFSLNLFNNSVDATDNNLFITVLALKWFFKQTKSWSACKSNAELEVRCWCSSNGQSSDQFGFQSHSHAIWNNTSISSIKSG